MANNRWIQQGTATTPSGAQYGDDVVLNDGSFYVVNQSGGLVEIARLIDVIAKTGDQTLNGALTLNGISILPVDGSIWMQGGGSRLRIHYDKNNALWFHKYSGSSSTPTATPMVINGDNSIRLSSILKFTSGEYVGSEAGGVLTIRGNGGVTVKTTSGAFTIIQASSFVQQSSERYKNIIEEMPEDQAKKLLDLEFIKFTYKPEYNDDGEKIHYGIRAEQADELGMGDIVSYDAEGRPDGVDYSKLTAYLGALVQRQEKRISVLEQKAEKYDALSALLVEKGLLTQEEIDGLGE